MSQLLKLGVGLGKSAENNSGGVGGELLGTLLIDLALSGMQMVDLKEGYR